MKSGLGFHESAVPGDGIKPRKIFTRHPTDAGETSAHQNLSIFLQGNHRNIIIGAGIKRVRQASRRVEAGYFVSRNAANVGKDAARHDFSVLLHRDRVDGEVCVRAERVGEASDRIKPSNITASETVDACERTSDQDFSIRLQRDYSRTVEA